jgi:hypothetical protein
MFACMFSLRVLCVLCVCACSSVCGCHAVSAPVILMKSFERMEKEKEIDYMSSYVV